MVDHVMRRSVFVASWRRPALCERSTLCRPREDAVEKVSPLLGWRQENSRVIRC